MRFLKRLFGNFGYIKVSNSAGEEYINVRAIQCLKNHRYSPNDNYPTCDIVLLNGSSYGTNMTIEEVEEKIKEVVG